MKSMADVADEFEKQLEFHLAIKLLMSYWALLHSLYRYE